MKRARLTLLIAFLLLLYIGPAFFASSYGHTAMPTEENMVKDFTPAAVAEWFNVSWLHRKSVTITGSSGAGTDYQVKIPVTYDSDMQSDFDDLRFTAYDGVTEWDYWIESYVASTSAAVWVEVSANLDTTQYGYMYYGNNDVSTTSSGFDTFQAFYDKTSITGWTTSGGLTVTTSGEYLRFYNPVPENVGYAQRIDITTSADFQYMARYKTVSLGSADQGTTILIDDSITHRFSQSITPFFTAQNEWKYYDGVAKAGGAWVEGTEFIFTMQIDEGDSTNGIDYRRYNTSWVLQDSILNENFALGSPTDCDGFNIGDQSGAGTGDLMYAWIAFRKCIDTEPVFDSFGNEEYYRFWHTLPAAQLCFEMPTWNIINTAILKFVVELFTGSLDAWFILLGLVMIPASTLFLVRGGKDGLSHDKVFYFLIIFFLGWALFIGGIMP